MRFLTVSLDKHAISWAERRRTKLKSTKLNYHGNITTIGFRKKDGDIRYLTPLNIKNKQRNIVVSKSGIKYIDYKDADFLLKFVNEQGKFFLVVLTGT
jgi:ribosomal protein S18